MTVACALPQRTPTMLVQLQRLSFHNSCTRNLDISLKPIDFMSEYILKTEFWNNICIFNHSASSLISPVSAGHVTKFDLTWTPLNYVIIFLICSHIKLSGATNVWTIWQMRKIILPIYYIRFSYFIHSPHSDYVPCNVWICQK